MISPVPRLSTWGVILVGRGWDLQTHPRLFWWLNLGETQHSAKAMLPFGNIFTIIHASILLLKYPPSKTPKQGIIERKQLFSSAMYMISIEPF